MNHVVIEKPHQIPAFSAGGRGHEGDKGGHLRGHMGTKGDMRIILQWGHRGDINTRRVFTPNVPPGIRGHFVFRLEIGMSGFKPLTSPECRDDMTYVGAVVGAQIYERHNGDSRQWKNFYIQREGKANGDSRGYWIAWNGQRFAECSDLQRLRNRHELFKAIQRWFETEGARKWKQ